MTAGMNGSASRKQSNDTTLSLKVEALGSSKMLEPHIPYHNINDPDNFSLLTAVP
jgi:hypothetical protein